MSRLLDAVPPITAYRFGSAAAPYPGQIRAQGKYFLKADGSPWSYQGASDFRLFARYCGSEDIEPRLQWNASKGVTIPRVLGFIPWAGQLFGPSTFSGYWERLPSFVDLLRDHHMLIEFTVFAGMQEFRSVNQRDHLRRVVDLIGGKENVLIEIANEPWQNGVTPTDLWGRGDSRPCPMAYGDYEPIKIREADGRWVALLPVLDYVTSHSPRDRDAWSRKAKDLSELRDGSGDGSENGPLLVALNVPPVGDEPMGAAERTTIGGRQRSAEPNDFFWYHANAHINGAGSTFHCDAGLQSDVPPPGGDQDQCADACALAWANIPPEFQQGRYTRTGLDDLPLAWQGDQFPEQTSRIYARLLGNRAMAVAIKPRADWVPEGINGWRVVSAVGPQNSLVTLER